MHRYEKTRTKIEMGYTTHMIAWRYALRVLFALIFLSPSVALGASVSLDPASGSYGPGDTFIVAIRLNTDATCINAGQVELVFPKDILRAVDVSRGESIFSLWVQEPLINNDSGTIVFSGGTPGGYCGKIDGDPQNSDVLADVVFTVLKSAATSASLSLGTSTEMFLNDGHGTVAPLSVQGATFTIRSTAALSSNAWLEQVQSDTTPPEPFTISVESDPSVFGGAYFAVFSTTDKQSGIDHYEILENGFWQRATNPHKLMDQTIQNPIEIKAFDKAGNTRLSVYNSPATLSHSSRITDFSMIVVPFMVLVLLLAIRWFIVERRRTSDVSTPS